MKSIEKVQKGAKVLSILSKIAYYGSMVAGCLCLVGAIIVGICGNDPWIARQLADSGVEYNTKLALCECVCSVVVCAASVWLYYYIVKFYDKELKIGTPYNRDVTKDMKIVGLLHIIMSLSVSVIVAIIELCFRVNTDIELGGFWIGIVYLVFAYVLEAGIEKMEGAPVENNAAAEEVKLQEGATTETPKVETENVETPKVDTTPIATADPVVKTAEEQKSEEEKQTQKPKARKPREKKAQTKPEE